MSCIRHRGYSLVELLVSMAITGVLAGVIAAICFHGFAAAGDAAAAGRFEREWMALRLALVRDMANVHPVAGIAFEGQRSSFSCSVREGGGLSSRRIGQLRYAQAGEGMSRVFAALPGGEPSTDLFALSAAVEFRYLDGKWAHGEWRAEWNGTGFPTAVACLLPETGETVTAPVGVAAFVEVPK